MRGPGRFSEVSCPPQLLEIPTRITERAKVTVYDEDIMMDDFVGDCMLSVEEMCAMGESKPRWFDLQYEGKKSERSP